MSIIKVSKIGSGKDDTDPIRPDITDKHFRKIEETETEFLIEVLDGETDY